MSGVELVFDESIDDWAFTDCLVSDENDFELDCVFFMGGQTQILIEFSAHLLKSNYYQIVSIIFQFSIYGSLPIH